VQQTGEHRSGWVSDGRRLTMATTMTHRRSVHIDAPVEAVFDYVKDPHHFFEAFPEEDRNHTALTEVTLTPEGVGSTFRMMGRVFLLFHMEWVLTREEYEPNKRILDRANAGGVWEYTFEPDETGTTLTIAFGWTSRIPFAAEVIDRISWDGDHDLDVMLNNVKKAIESS
jgi:uncharacterized protein YndB with AHSA1/START domain